MSPPEDRSTLLKESGNGAQSGFSAHADDDPVGHCPQTAWIEIELVDEFGEPAPGELFHIQPAQGPLRESVLDENGRGRIEKIASGTCTVVFPRRDPEWFKPPKAPPAPPMVSSRVIEATLPQNVWIEIALVDEFGNPVSGEPFRIEPQDGAPAVEGVLDEYGFAHVAGLSKGKCKVLFPHRENLWWEPIKEDSPPAI
ncbi:MAG: hypothetical protein V3S05_07240 [Desulfobacterales bacterium]